MEAKLEEFILHTTQSKMITHTEEIQSLWSGYGKILRCELQGSDLTSVVVKHICLREDKDHPRGWNNDFSHQRKLRSYQVEVEWYKKYASLATSKSLIPKCLGVEAAKDEILIILEDLDELGFPKNIQRASWKEVQICLSWLAHFHATYLGVKPMGLWKTGTYWHLKTRPDELDILNDRALKAAAPAIDQALNHSPFKTFVHGDAKLANFNFSYDLKRVAAVDFQYVGGGIGMKDVAYFVGSCFGESDSEKFENKILDFYFGQLKKALQEQEKEVDFASLEKDWRNLYPFAWADFHRFLKGWSPGHWKLNTYSERITKEVLKRVGS